MSRFDAECLSMVGTIMLVKNDQFPFYDEKNTPYLEGKTAVVVGSYEGAGNFIVTVRGGYMYPVHHEDLVPVHEDVIGAIRYYMYGELGISVPKNVVSNLLFELLKLEPDYLRDNEEEDVAITLCRFFKAAHGWGLTMPTGEI